MRLPRRSLYTRPIEQRFLTPARYYVVPLFSPSAFAVARFSLICFLFATCHYAVVADSFIDIISRPCRHYYFLYDMRECAACKHRKGA